MVIWLLACRPFSYPTESWRVMADLETWGHTTELGACCRFGTSFLFSAY